MSLLLWDRLGYMMYSALMLLASSMWFCLVTSLCRVLLKVKISMNFVLDSREEEKSGISLEILWTYLQGR
jgi:hypothetical protein